MTTSAQNGTVQTPDTTDQVLPFRGETDSLSNFYPIPGGIEDNNLTHPTVEHAYQCSKAIFHNRADLIPIIQRTPKPRDVQLLQQQKLRNKLTPAWHATKYEIMKRLINKKIAQLPELTNRIMSTKGTIAEATSNLYWVSGLDKYYTVTKPEDQWPGENNLGKIYMEIRQKKQDKIRNSKLTLSPLKSTARKVSSSASFKPNQPSASSTNVQDTALQAATK